MYNLHILKIDNHKTHYFLKEDELLDYLDKVIAEIISGYPNMKCYVETNVNNILIKGKPYMELTLYERVLHCLQIEHLNINI